MSFSRRSSLTLLFSISIVSFTVICTGCSEQRSMTPVTGTVYYNGKPLDSGTVFFQSSHGQPSQGELKPDGSFELITLGHGEGSFLGKHLVRVESYKKQDSRRVREGDEEAPGIFAIPKKYADFRRSGIEVDIAENQTEPIEIHLGTRAK